jgi:hypothetical protein
MTYFVQTVGGEFIRSTAITQIAPSTFASNSSCKFWIGDVRNIGGAFSVKMSAKELMRQIVEAETPLRSAGSVCYTSIFCSFWPLPDPSM